MTSLLGLRLRTPRLELRLPADDELVHLAHVAEAGVHPREEMPFYDPWTDRIGEPGFVAGFVEFHLEQRRTWHVENWHLLLGVWARHELAGCIGASATSFPSTRTVETGSWLGRRYQGHGYGTEMRAAVLELAFGGLGARLATSGALEGSSASTRVSEKLGYERAGERVAAPRGSPVRELRFSLTREAWSSRPRPSVQIVGLEPCLPLFGADR